MIHLRVFVTGLALLAAPVAAAPRDGAHDFDFDLGRWHTQSSRLMHPLANASDWVDLDGETNVSPIWGGKGNLAEYKAQGPNGPLELIAIRLFNPKTQQWAINFATPGVGMLGAQPGVGEVQDGRMTFYDQEDYAGRQIWVRFQIWSIDPDHAQSEQAFSVDGGKSWEVNWINRYTRLPA
jgi:hypothetical protein